MRYLLIALVASMALVGCKSDSGDVSAAEKAAAAAPKSVDQLPQDMPEAAKAGAAAAIGQGAAQQQMMEQQNDARKRAMEEMRKQGGGG